MGDNKKVSVGWVKLGKVWWPGKILDADEWSDEMKAEVQRLKGKKSVKVEQIQVVKFFNEDDYEVIHNPTQILVNVDEEKKIDLVKRAVSSMKSSATMSENQSKFKTDVLHAERLLNPSTDLTQLTRLLDGEPLEPKKPAGVNKYSDIFKTPKQEKSPAGASSVRSTKSLSPAIKFHFTSSRIINAASSKPPSKVAPLPSDPSKKYKCSSCPFSADRVNVITSHMKFCPGRTQRLSLSASASTPKTPTVAPSSPVKHKVTLPPVLASPATPTPPVKRPPGRPPRSAKTATTSASSPKVATPSTFSAKKTRRSSITATVVATPTLVTPVAPTPGVSSPKKRGRGAGRKRKDKQAEKQKAEILQDWNDSSSEENDSDDDITLQMPPTKPPELFLFGNEKKKRKAGSGETGDKKDSEGNVGEEGGIAAEARNEDQPPVLKKPRTDKELSDAFEALLKTTKPDVDKVLDKDLPVGAADKNEEEEMEVEEDNHLSDIEEDAHIVIKKKGGENMEDDVPALENKEPTVAEFEEKKELESKEEEIEERTKKLDEDKLSIPKRRSTDEDGEGNGQKSSSTSESTNVAVAAPTEEIKNDERKGDSVEKKEAEATKDEEKSQHKCIVKQTQQKIISESSKLEALKIPTSETNEVVVVKTKTPENNEVVKAKIPEKKEVGRAKTPEKKEVVKAKTPEIKEVGKAKTPEKKEVVKAKTPEKKEVAKAKTPEKKEVAKAKTPEKKEVVKAKTPEKKEAVKPSLPEKKVPVKSTSPEKKENFKITTPEKTEAVISATLQMIETDSVTSSPVVAKEKSPVVAKEKSPVVAKEKSPVVAKEKSPVVVQKVEGIQEEKRKVSESQVTPPPSTVKSSVSCPSKAKVDIPLPELKPTQVTSNAGVSMPAPPPVVQAVSPKTETRATLSKQYTSGVQSSPEKKNVVVEPPKVSATVPLSTSLPVKQAPPPPPIKQAPPPPIKQVPPPPIKQTPPPPIKQAPLPPIKQAPPPPVGQAPLPPVQQAVPVKQPPPPVFLKDDAKKVETAEEIPKVDTTTTPIAAAVVATSPSITQVRPPPDQIPSKPEHTPQQQLPQPPPVAIKKPTAAVRPLVDTNVSQQNQSQKIEVPPVITKASDMVKKSSAPASNPPLTITTGTPASAPNTKQAQDHLQQQQSTPNPTTQQQQQQQTQQQNAKANGEESQEDKKSPALVAQRVVHLVPVENHDGTITYMLLSLENGGDNPAVVMEQGGVDQAGAVLRLDKVEPTEGAGVQLPGPMNPNEVEGIFLDKNVENANQIVSALAASSAASATSIMETATTAYMTLAMDASGVVVQSPSTQTQTIVIPEGGSVTGAQGTAVVTQEEGEMSQQVFYMTEDGALLDPQSLGLTFEQLQQLLNQ